MESELKRGTLLSQFSIMEVSLNFYVTQSRSEHPALHFFFFFSVDQGILVLPLLSCFNNNKNKYCVYSVHGYVFNKAEWTVSIFTLSEFLISI